MYRRQMKVVGAIHKVKHIEVVEKIRKELMQFQVKTQKL